MTNDIKADAQQILIQLKQATLSDFLEQPMDDISVSLYDDCVFEADGGEYLVLTETEANAKAAEYIEDSLWAFRAESVLSQCGLDQDLAPMLRAYQEKQCEGANDAIKSIVTRCGGLESFVQAAISADGREHFLSTYDGQEHQIGEFFIYRIN
jgi:hypothetical protein